MLTNTVQMSGNFGMTVTVNKRKQNDPSLARSIKLERSKSANYGGKRTLATETKTVKI